MQIAETFVVSRPPEAVFDYVTDPTRLVDWQTSKTAVQQLGDGPVGPGSRFRERTKPRGAREFEQITEFTVFERPRQLRVHVVEGPQPIDGTWTFYADPRGTRVSFVAEGELRGPLRLLSPLVARVMARQFAVYHRTLRANLERVPAL